MTPKLAALLAISVTACQAADDDAELRSFYTTNVTLSGGSGGSCEPTQDFDVNPRRSLFETHQVALAPFTMPAVLDAVAVNGGLAPQSVTTHDQFMDIYNPAPGLGLGQHCNDEVAFNGTPGLNGYPLQCGRAEGGQIGNIDDWFAIAAVNRFDLAPSDGSNCGEARLVMASNAQNRMFVIFEAQVPNPNPGCGIEACAPVQEFWAGLSDIDDPTQRADQLRMAFLDGHPKLLAAGFGPFISQQNLTFGTGQIRTNNFDQFPWSLREFKAISVLVDAPIDPIDPIEPTPIEPMPIDAQMDAMPVAEPVDAFPGIDPLPPQPAPIGVLRIVEVPVAANPFGELWNGTIALPNGAACRDALVETVQHLMTNDPNLMGVSVPSACLAAESPDTSVQQYHQRLAAGGTGPGSLHQRIQDRILQLDPTSTLTPTNIARRAAFAGGCIGCHQQTNGASLGNGVVAPSSAFFVHTSEQSFEACGDGSSQCFVISSALKDTFLPHRESVMETFLNGGPCCEPLIDPIDPIDPIGPFDPLPLEPVMEPMAADAVDVEAMLEMEAQVEAQESPVTVSGASTHRSH